MPTFNGNAITRCAASYLFKAGTTNHLGTGRCKYHGGSTPIKHGLYAKVVPAAMQEIYRAALENQDPTSMREQIALIDGVILPGALKRGTTRPGKPGVPDPLVVSELCAR